MVYYETTDEEFISYQFFFLLIKKYLKQKVRFFTPQNPEAVAGTRCH